MNENSSKRMSSRIKRGENLVKSVMLANGVHKPSRRAVLLTTLASESFIAALTQDAVVFKSPNERLRVYHIIKVLAGSSRYSFVRNVLRKFQVDFNNDQSAFKEQIIGFNKTARIQRQKPLAPQDSQKNLLNPDSVSKSTTNQNEEADPENKDEHTEKKEGSFNNTKPNVNFE